MTLTIKGLIDGIPKLGSYAGVLKELDRVLNDGRSTLADVSQAIEKDPALTARLLKLGNSSFFGFAGRLETVFDAISLVGLLQVRDIITACSVIQSFDGISTDRVNMESYWKHCLACGVAARVLAIVRRLPKPETYFVTGLLHDVGRLVLFSRAPQQTREIFQRCNPVHSKLLRDAEKSVLGFDHAEIGAALLRSWDYPANLVNGVCYHHAALAAGTFQIEACVIHVADHLVNAMQLGSAGERYVPLLDMQAWERLNLSVSMLELVVDSIDDQVLAVEEAFLSPQRGL